MADIKGFLKVKRKESEYRPVCGRLKDYREVILLPKETHSQEQASRCMDCGTPFCHWACPIGNYIPEWNDLFFRGHWERALELLHACNNFPEFTGRLCPTLCEYSCVLGINDEPVTIKENELSIIEHAFRAGLIKPRRLKKRTGKRVAVIGSGPAGLACADQLNQLGHQVVVFEKDDKIGGILRYGIPDFKLEKWLIDRRLKIIAKEGVEFNTGVNVGIRYSAAKLLKEFDAVALACGCRVPRDFPPKADQPTAEKIKGRELSGIHFAMDYLIQSNKRVSGETIVKDKEIIAKGKRVVVIGGGDTGADCVGTANRQGALCVVQIEVLPKPLEYRGEDCPWPRYPLLLKASSSHEEGGERRWSILTKKFIGENGWVKKLSCVQVDAQLKEIPGTEFEIAAGLVILAMGFLHTEHKGLAQELGLEFDAKGNIKTGDSYMASVKGVFSCGDMRRGQSLVVWAIYEGREAASNIDKYLTVAY